MKKWFRRCDNCKKEGNYPYPINPWIRYFTRCKYCLANTLNHGEEKEINLVTGKIVELDLVQIEDSEK